MATLNNRRVTSRSLRGRVQSERGAEIIEMAIVAPILALLIAAMFDFGFLFRNWEVVTNAAREGARVGVLSSYSCDAGSADVQGRVDAYMAGAGIGGNYDVELKTDTVAAGGHTFSACVVKVTLEQGLPSLAVMGTIFGGSFGSVSVAAASVMRTEAQGIAAP